MYKELQPLICVGVFTNPCPNYNGGLTKPPLKLGHGLVITSELVEVELITYP